MRNTDYAYQLNRWLSRSHGTSSSPSGRYYTVRWDDLRDDEDLFYNHLRDIKWKFEDPFDPYREFVEVRNEKAPKLPDSYPKGDLDDLLGFGSGDG